MRKYLLQPESETNHYYKANLHCHSVMSDGKKTIEQIKADYKAHGYSAVAFTDHDTFYTHNDMTDDSFVALNGYEISFNMFNQPKDQAQKVCHINLIAKNAEKARPVYYGLPTSRYASEENADFFSIPTRDLEYTPEVMARVLRMAKANNFFVTYNHPAWSMEQYEDYLRFVEADAMEMVNWGCISEGYEEVNGHAYDDMLRTGHKLYCLSTDDNHNNFPDGSPYSDSYGGFVQMAAPNLSYDSLIHSLETGNFYSVYCPEDNAPEIRSMYLEDGELTVETSPARSVIVECNIRASRVAIMEKNQPLTKATFKLHPSIRYFRVIVTDQRGYQAYSNAYFLY